MNRHHPYGGGGFESRRGGSPSGPGPERSHGKFQDRGGGRGRGRGRGAYNTYAGGYGQEASYGSSTPETYNSWNGSQDYHSNQSAVYTNDGGAYNSPYNDSYEQNHSGYEDGFQTRGRPGGRGRGGPPRREKDDKIHDNLIEERIMRERPCRTLFIRNIKYETDSNDVRRKFEEHGDIKTFFDLISSRGMVFVTYFDLRASERARERLQDTSISGRPIDVHYSLPRADEQNAKDPKDRNQGTLLVRLQSGQSIDDGEVRRRFSMFGDIKGIKPGSNPVSERLVEYYDIRSCDDAYERMNHQPLQDGTMEIVYSSDISDDPLHSGQLPSRHDGDGSDHSFGHKNHDDWTPNRGRRGGRGGRGRGGPPREDWERRDNWDRERDRSGLRDDYGGRGRGRGRGGGGGGYGDRSDQGGESYGGPPGPGNYVTGPPSGPPPGPPPINQPSAYGSMNAPQATGAIGDDRLEQARKVQQLLAALKQPQGPRSPTTAPTGGGVVSNPPLGPPITGQYYPGPAAPGILNNSQAPYSGLNMYNMTPLGPQQPPQTAPPSMAGLPPNILAMLSQTGAQQPSQPNGPPIPPPYAMPPFPPNGLPLGNNGSTAGQSGYNPPMPYMHGNQGNMNR